MKKLIQKISLTMLLLATPVLAADLEDAVTAGDMAANFGCTS